jgi:hypothetical protein
VNGQKTIASDAEATRNKVKAQFDKMSAEIDKLKAEAEKISADQRREFYDYVETLDEKRNRLKSRIDDLKEAGDSAIGELEAGMKEAWQRIAIAKKAAEARFRSDAGH